MYFLQITIEYFQKIYTYGPAIPHCLRSNPEGYRLMDQMITDHCSDVIMIAMASQITGVSIVCSTVCSGADLRKHQSFASLALVRGIHRRPVDFPHKGSVTRKIFLFDDVIMFMIMLKQSKIRPYAYNKAHSVCGQMFSIGRGPGWLFDFRHSNNLPISP